MWKQKVSCFNAVAKAAKHLHSQHGEVSARKLVASELRKARRARCRKRFIFWESVAAQLATTGLDDRPRRREQTIEARGERSSVPSRDRVRLEKFPDPVTVSLSPSA
jgi:hypothetical protein